jgi:hypothetical protein
MNVENNLINLPAWAAERIGSHPPTQLSENLSAILEQDSSLTSILRLIQAAPMTMIGGLGITGARPLLKTLRQSLKNEANQDIPDDLLPRTICLVKGYLMGLTIGRL